MPGETFGAPHTTGPPGKRHAGRSSLDAVTKSQMSPIDVKVVESEILRTFPRNACKVQQQQGKGRCRPESRNTFRLGWRLADD